MEFNDPSIVSAVLSDPREGASSTPPVLSSTSSKKPAGTNRGDSNMDQFMNFIKLSKELRTNNRTSSSLGSNHETSPTKNSDRYIKLLRPALFEPDSSLDFKPDLHNKTHVYSINDLISLSVQVPKAIIDQKLLDLPKRKFWRLHQRHQDYIPHKGVNHRTNSNGSVNSTGNKSTSSLNSSASNLSMNKWRTFSGEGNNNNNNNNNNSNNNTISASTTATTGTTTGTGTGTSNYERRNSRARGMRSGFQSLSDKKQAQLGLIGSAAGSKATGGNDNDSNGGTSHSSTPSSITTNRVTEGKGSTGTAPGNRRVSSAGNVSKEDKEKAEFMQELDASFEPTGNTAADFEAWRAKMKELDRQKRLGSSDTRDSKAKSPVVTGASLAPSSGSAGSSGLRTSSISHTPHHTSNPISDFLNMSRRGTAHGDTPVEALDKDKESSKQGKGDTVDSDSLVTENGGHEMNSRSSSSRFASFFKNSEAAKKEGSKTPLGEEAAAAVTTTNNGTASVGGSKLMNFFRDTMESNTPSTESVELNSPTANPTSSLNVTTGNMAAPQQGFFMDPQPVNPSNSNNIFFANLLNKNKPTTGGRDSPASSSAVLMAPPGLTGPSMPMHPMNDANFAENLPPPGLQFPPGPPGPHMLPHNFPPQMMPTNPPPGIISPPDNRGNSNRSVDRTKNDGTTSLPDKERSTSNNSSKSNGTLNGPDQQGKPQMEQRQQQQQQQQFMPMMAPPMGFMPMSGMAPNMQFAMPPPKVGFPPQPANGQGQMQPSFPLPPLPPPAPGNMAMGPLQQPRNLNANISISANGGTLPPGVPRNGNSGPFIPGGNMQGFFPPGFIPPQQLQQSASQQGQRQPMNMPMPQK